MLGDVGGNRCEIEPTAGESVQRNHHGFCLFSRVLVKGPSFKLEGGPLAERGAQADGNSKDWIDCFSTGRSPRSVGVCSIFTTFS